VVADLFNTAYRALVLFLRFFPPGCVRVVVDLFNTVHYLLVLLVLCSTHSNVFVSHPDVSAWWWTYLTRCIAHWYCFYVSFPPDVSAWWWTYLTRCITYWSVRVVVDLFNTEVSGLVFPGTCA